MRFTIVLAAVAIAACSAPDPYAGMPMRHAASGNLPSGGSGNGAPSAAPGDGTSSGDPGGGKHSTPSPVLPGGGNDGGAPVSAADSGASDAGSPSAADGGTTGGSPPLLQHCVDAINSYRAQIGAPPYARGPNLEAYAAQGAHDDSQSAQAHGHFGATSGGGVAYAENELPGWPLGQYASMTDLIDQGLAAMWNEGPGGGHYENMASTQYTSVGCGSFTPQDQNVWVTIDFR